MKWLKENWGWLVIILGLILILLSGQMGIKNYKREIRAVSDSLVVLGREYQELEKEAHVKAELISAYKFADSLYRDSLQFSNRQLINQKRSYEKAMADLRRVPTDTLYRELTGWYDSLSVHWGAGSDDGSR